MSVKGFNATMDTIVDDWILTFTCLPKGFEAKAVNIITDEKLEYPDDFIRMNDILPSMYWPAFAKPSYCSQMETLF